MNFYLQPEQLLDFVEDVGILKDAGEFLSAGAEGIDGYHDAAVVAGGEFAYNLAFLQVAAYEGQAARLMVGGDDDQGLAVAGSPFIDGADGAVEVVRLSEARASRSPRSAGRGVSTS